MAYVDERKSRGFRAAAVFASMVVSLSVTGSVSAQTASEAAPQAFLGAGRQDGQAVAEL